MQRIRVIDSHTGGEPTRVVIGGVPEPEGATMIEKREFFGTEMDWVRTSCINEPRGFDAIVGAMLCESTRDDCVAGVIFFNNIRCIWGCVHGTIGLAVTLAHLGKIGPGEHGIDTPVGVVKAQLGENGEVTVKNVRSYRHSENVPVEVPGYGEVRGDIAWGGNWFFLLNEPTGLIRQTDLIGSKIETLTKFTVAVRESLEKNGITGADDGEIDHIEVFGPPSDPEKADSKNFVLCPGAAYDRSPCGTGTSAKLACLAASGKLKPGETWRQAGIVDSVFEGSIEFAEEGGVIPTIRGSAFVTGEAELILNAGDPFQFGIPDS